MDVSIENQTKPKLFKTRSFANIDIKPDSLVLCDIDDTVLTYPLDLTHWFNKTKAHLIAINDYWDDEDCWEIALNEFSDYRKVTKPIHTDDSGFKLMEDKISSTNGQLMFITARSTQYKEKTHQDLKAIGINWNSYPIHFTLDHKMSKAEYVGKFIDTSRYSQIYLIDDNVPTVKLMKLAFPHAQCYIFCKNATNAT
jgi:hypothetical protein